MKNASPHLKTMKKGKMQTWARIAKNAKSQAKYAQKEIKANMIPLSRHSLYYLSYNRPIA